MRDFGDLQTQCCIAGGGPAGIMLGFLLARQGVDVVVLEKWPDFFRDFRGDTIHPSTLTILKELGLLDKFLQLPHNQTEQIAVHVGGESANVADFRHIGAVVPFLAFVPQWDFLNFITTEAKKFPNFHLHMETEAIGVDETNGKVIGVRARSKEGEFTITADLVVGADGRDSTIRAASKLKSHDLKAPIDVLWFRLSQTPNEEAKTLGYIDKRHMMVLIDRDTYWQCGFLIRKGDLTRVQDKGLDAFRKTIAAIAPILKDKVHELTSWDSVKLLSVTVDRLYTWYKPGLLCIGDSAHAMSPVGGVGINLAIADAVAAANILGPAFMSGEGVTIQALSKIQRRRELPARIIQYFQVFIQTHILEPVLKNNNPKMPLPLRVLNRVPFLQRIPAFLIGFGFRPEHVEGDSV